MKQKSNEMPMRIHDLGDGRSHFNYNITESVDEDGNALFQYDQVVVSNPATRDKIIVSLIREEYTLDDEIAMLRQKDQKPALFQEYFDFVESRKVIADE